MSTKTTRSGGKYTGNHTTVIPIAGTACDIADACPAVEKISLGFIKMGLRPTEKRRVKILDESGAILLSARDNTSCQEVWVWSSDPQVAKLAIARGLRDEGISIAFTR